MKNKFKRGTVVVFKPESFNSGYWDNMSEEDKIKYYGVFGYGKSKPKFFVYLTDIKNAPGHCVLLSLDDQKIETMVHDSEFREVTEEEF